MINDIEIWEKVKFEKINISIKSNDIYLVSNYGNVKKNNKFIGSYNKPGKRTGSNIKINGKKIMIKLLVVCTFIENYDIELFDIIEKDKDKANCRLDNLELKIKPCKIIRYYETEEEILNLFNEYLEKNIFNKMCFYVLNQKKIYETKFYSYDDYLQDISLYVFNNLYKYKKDLKINFETFLYYKIYDAVALLVRKNVSYTDLSLDMILDSYKKKDKNNIVSSS